MCHHQGWLQEFMVFMVVRAKRLQQCTILYTLSLRFAHIAPPPLFGATPGHAIFLGVLASYCECNAYSSYSNSQLIVIISVHHVSALRLTIHVVLQA